jgi:hypothetical protein
VRILALAVWGFFSLGGANAGTCVNRQDGTDTVQACDNGSYTVTNRHGRRRVYGTPNAGLANCSWKWRSEGKEKAGAHGGDRKSSSVAELEDLGVTKKQSHNWQKLGG